LYNVLMIASRSAADSTQRIHRPRAAAGVRGRHAKHMYALGHLSGDGHSALTVTLLGSVAHRMQIIATTAYVLMIASRSAADSTLKGYRDVVVQEKMTTPTSV